MSDYDYDLLVLGGGSAGSACAAEAVKQGHAKVGLINDGELGGLCILRGCMPTKTLLASSDILLEARHGKELGIEANDLGFDIERIQERRAELVARFKRAKVSGMENAWYEILDGRVRFDSPGTVQVRMADGSERTLTSRAFLISTGSRHSLPPTKGLDSVPYWTSDDVLESHDVPETLLVQGSGAVGLEFATYYAGLGTKVCLVSRSPILNRGADAELSQMYRNALEATGIHVLVHHEIDEVSQQGGKIRAIVSGNEGAVTMHFDRYLVATGRAANLESLNLEAAGIEHSGPRLKLGPALETTNRNVFAAGDATNDRLILHTGNAEGRHVARNLTALFKGAELEPWDEKIPLMSIFTHPPYAEAGLREDQAVERGIDVISARKNWADQGRGIVMGAVPEAAFIKLIAAREDGRLLGAQILGPRADDLIHVVSTAIHLGGRAQDFVEMPWYHPTLSEAFIELGRELVAQQD